MCCAALTLATAVSAVAATAVAELASKPAKAQPYFRALAQEGERNAVLNLERAGLAAMEVGDDADAAEAFDQALRKIETVYADNETAKKARSKFTKESVKNYKGEPYERAMAFYYRGLLYMRAGDYENARASFRGGLLQDEIAEDQKYSGDFALLTVLAGWSSQCLGQASQAKDFYADAEKVRPGIRIPGPEDHVMLIAELGDGPRKWSDGKYKENLRFKPADPRPERKASFALGGATLDGSQGENLYFQASTRGGRQIDGILSGKASFKSGAEDLSGAASTGAMIASQMSTNATNYGAASGMAYASVALSAFSLGSAMFAAATKPQADIRYWDTLPADIVFATAPKNDSALGVSFLDDTGKLVRRDELSIKMDPGGRCGLGWVRADHAYDAPPSAPNADLKS